MTAHTATDAVPYVATADDLIDFPATSLELATLLERWRPTRQTGAPGSPADGDGWLYPADETNGVYWDLRYRSGGAAQPWRFVGGSELTAEVLTDQTVPAAQTAYSALATPCAVVLPFAGVYDVLFGASMYPTGAAASMLFAPGLGGAPGSDNDAVQIQATATVAMVTGSRKIRRTYAAGTLALYHRSGAAQTTNALRRWMSVRPVALAP